MKATDQRFCGSHCNLVAGSVISSIGRSWVAAALLLLSLAASGASAQVYTHETYGQELDKTTRVQSLDHFGQFGEVVDINSGAVSFRKTVVEIPGNNQLRVAIDYALNLKTNAGNAPMYYWDRELPYIEGTHGKDHGWVVGVPGNYSGQRCSHSSAVLGAPVIRSTKPPINNFNREEYWNGNSLVVPGGEGGVIRPIGSDETRPSGMDVRWATNSGWRFTCYQLENGSEGFVGHSQNGDKLYFGAPVADTEVFQIMNSFAPYNDTWVEVVSYRMYLTRIEDRFGNWVKYEPHQVTSNDGRVITIERSGSSFIYKASGRTWTVSGSNVLNPGGSTWSLAHSGQFGWSGDQQVFGDTCRSAQAIPSTIGGGVSITIITESGAKGVFRVEPRRHGYSYVPYRCYVNTPPHGPGKEGGHSYPDQLHYIDQVSLVSRSVEGSGVQSYQEVIDYGQLNACYQSGSVTPPDQCQAASPITKTVTITRSDGLVRRFVYGNRWGQNAGLLLSEQIGNSRRTDRSYVFLNDRVPSGYGKRQIHYNVYEYKIVRVKNSTVSQQGISFAYDVESFDSFARPTRVTRRSSISGSPVRTELVAYHDNLSRWVLGQPSKLTVNGTVVSETGYSSYAQPLIFKSYGKLQWTRTHDVTTAGQMGTIKTIQDGNNNVTTFSSWKRGIPQTTTYADGTTRKAVVNDVGWITRITDENGYATNYAYDPMGRLSKITYPTGDSTAWTATTISFAPQPNGAYGLPAGFWRQDIITGDYHKNVYFDALWRPVLVRERDNSQPSATSRFQRFTYDHEGRVTFTSYPSTSSGPTTGTWTEYDALGRPTSVSQDSEHGLLTTLTEYLSSFRTRVTHPNGQKTTTSYLAWDQPTTEFPVLISTTHSGGFHTDIARDVYGKPTAITRRNSNSSVALTRKYVYRSDYQTLCKIVDPEAGVTVQDHDGAGNLLWTASGLDLVSTVNCTYSSVPAARKVHRTYDARNRIKTLAFPDGKGNQTWTYTPDGLPASVEANNGDGNVATTSYTYNRRRLMTQERLITPWYNWPITYAYNGNGHLASQNWHGLTVAYAPNALGQPTQAGTYATDVSYYPNGAIKAFTYGNGVVHSMTQNARRLPSAVVDCALAGTSCANSNKRMHLTYEYDVQGNVTKLRDYRGGWRDRNMTYDGLDRLTGVTSSTFGTASYTYDVLDNLKTVQVTGGSQPRNHTYTYDANWRLTKVTPSSGSAINLSYDVQGNLKSKGGVQYSFDYDNRLRSATGGSATSSYVYDAFGRRIRDETAAGPTYSQYNQAGQLLQSSDQRRKVFSEFIYLGSRLVAIRERLNNVHTIKYQHADVQGTPVAVTGENKALLQSSDYEPYGLLVNRPLTDGPGYTGHVQDAATGLTYMQQRYYDPTLGVFLSVDPVMAYSSPVTQFHRYRYANSNPYKFIDPDGRYGRGEGWSERDWKRFDRAQQAAAARIERSVSRITRALETGKGLKGVTRSFERTFGKGSATAENMGKVSSAMTNMAGALRDDGSNGYTASLVSQSEMATLTKSGDATHTLAAAEVGGKAMYVNRSHSEFGNNAELSRTAGHESAHNFGLRDQRLDGTPAYFNGHPNERDAFKNLPPELRLINPDHLMHFAR